MYYTAKLQNNSPQHLLESWQKFALLAESGSSLSVLLMHCYLYMLWFNVILGLNFISLCFKLIIIHYHTQKQREIKFKPRIKLNHNIYAVYSNIIFYFLSW